MKVQRTLYFKLCTIISVGLFVFATIIALIWSFVGADHYQRKLFDVASRTATVLLPRPEEPIEAQNIALKELSRELGFEITVWSSDEVLLGASGSPVRPPENVIVDSRWQSFNDDARWVTALKDGRILVIEVTPDEILDEGRGVFILLILITLFMSLVTYPFVRRLTSRLEQLQKEVVRVGQGDLSARVKVRGNDEVGVLARSFNNAADQIQALVESQKILLASASHELRTPLTRIRMGIEAIEHHGRREDLIASVKDDVKEIDEMVEELLVMVRLENADLSETMQDLDLSDIVSSECQRYPECAVYTADASIRGDERMVRRLIRNLVENAFRHGQAPVEVSVREDEEFVTLSVADGGSGIAEEDREKVFSPFYRSPKSRTREGYGLGLSIVKKIAESHHAEVSISSRPDSVVCVRFPKRVGEAK